MSTDHGASKIIRRVWCTAARRYYDGWVTHDCHGGLRDRIWCALPSDPRWARFVDRWADDDE